MKPVYEASSIQLYSGDVRNIMEDIELRDVAVVLSDPPYAVHNYIARMEERRHIDTMEDANWCGEVFAWVGTWWMEMRARSQTDAVGWFFCNVHYVGFYLRWAHMSGWPLRAIWSCPPNNEYLLAFGRTSIDPVAGNAIARACQSNTYGQNKPLPLLRLLLQYSPPGLVLDPFAGLGSTLEASRLEGRSAIGMEILPTVIERAVENLSHA